MRAAVLLFILTLGLATVSGPVAQSVEARQSEVVAAQQPAAAPQIEVEVDRGGGAWYTSPMWIAIGIIAIVLLVVIVAMAARGGGGTTIVSE